MNLKPAAERDLAALERRDLVRVARRIDALAQNPRPPGAEKLKGVDALWQVRAGDYRILYTIRDDVVLVLVVRVRHRREVYR
ncbi:MAG: type II toxin-antitoxin system RelE/ParE family toxin [Planctomycetota bacterium]